MLDWNQNAIGQLNNEQFYMEFYRISCHKYGFHKKQRV